MVAITQVQSIRATQGDVVFGQNSGGAGAAIEIPCTQAARDLLDDTTAAAMRTTLGVGIGVGVQAWDADLDALAALSTTGLIARTGAATYSLRTISSSNSNITVSNGDGVAGAPSLTLASSPSLSGLAITSAGFIDWGGTHTRITMTSGGSTFIDSDASILLRTDGASSFQTVLTVSSAGVLPNATNTYPLGGASNQWTTVHTRGLTLYGTTSGSTTVAASGTASGALTLPAATDTLVGKATTDTLTNKTYDTAGTGNVFKVNGTTLSAVTGTGSVVLGTTPTISQPNIVGTTTNDSAAAGSVGEYQETDVLVGSKVSLTSTVVANIATLSLTAGDWDVSGAVFFEFAGSTTATQLITWTSSTSATQPTYPNKGGSMALTLAFPAGANQVLTPGPKRFSLSGTTTIYLSVVATFAVSTMAAYGTIRARRIR